jgi:hypothetical protein
MGWEALHVQLQFWLKTFISTIFKQPYMHQCEMLPTLPDSVVALLTAAVW